MPTTSTPPLNADSSTQPATMLAARLYGPADLRVERVPRPGPPGPGMALLRVTAVGICGSDLHTYTDGRIGDAVVTTPLILGHEFGGVVEAVGPESLDGNFAPLLPGTRVAVDPAQPCGRCEMCEQGHPNLCHRLHFCGLYPDPGSLAEYMLMPAHGCFPMPDTIDNAGAALLEPLGVAIHAIDLAKIRVADSVVILGAGPIGPISCSWPGCQAPIRSTWWTSSRGGWRWRNGMAAYRSTSQRSIRCRRFTLPPAAGA